MAKTIKTTPGDNDREDGDPGGSNPVAADGSPAPKTMRLESWPVLPKAIRSITEFLPTQPGTQAV